MHHPGNLLHQILRRGHNDRLDARIRHGGDLCRLFEAVVRAVVAAGAVRGRHARKKAAAARRHRRRNGWALWALLPDSLLGKTLPNSVATSVGLAYCRWNTRISVSASALLSTASMICDQMPDVGLGVRDDDGVAGFVGDNRRLRRNE